MTDVSSWSPVDESNTAAPPDGWPEFMMPSGVNNCGRMMMGAVRRMYDQQISGAIVLPYLKLAGGQTVTGAVTFSSGLTASSIISNSTITATGNIASSASLTASGNVWGAGYVIGTTPLATKSGGEISLYDGVGAQTLKLAGSALTVVGGATVGGGLTVGAALIVTGAVTSNRADGLALYAPNGGATVAGAVTAGGAVTAFSPSFGLLRDGDDSHRYFSFKPNVAWALDNTNGNLEWYLGQTFWRFEGLTGVCLANLSYVAGHGAYVDLSDVSLKEQIAPAPQGLAEILQLQPKTFIRKQRLEGSPQRQELGFVAQDVQAALPHAVVEVDTGEGLLLGVAFEAIVAALVTAVKTMDARLTALEGGT